MLIEYLLKLKVKDQVGLDKLQRELNKIRKMALLAQMNVKYQNMKEKPKEMIDKYMNSDSDSYSYSDLDSDTNDQIETSLNLNPHNNSNKDNQRIETSLNLNPHNNRNKDNQR
jgi:hypothetical protein